MSGNTFVICSLRRNWPIRHVRPTSQVLPIFYRHIRGREVDYRFGLPPRQMGKILPAVLSMEEVSRLLNCIDNLKHRILLKTIYSAGLRVGEAIRLKPEHIDSDPSRMVFRVEQGKGRKDRYTVLSEHLLYELRAYWVEYSPKYWLFPGQKPGTHITNVSVSQILYDAKKKIGLTKECSLHTLRHYVEPGIMGSEFLTIQFLRTIHLKTLPIIITTNYIMSSAISSSCRPLPTSEPYLAPD